jgi:hypothetical protein
MRASVASSARQPEANSTSGPRRPNNRFTRPPSTIANASIDRCLDSRADRPPAFVRLVDEIEKRYPYSLPTDSGDEPQIRDAVRQARKLDDAVPVIVALFHKYDFEESGSREATIDLSQVDATLAWVADQPDVEIVTFRELLPAAGDFTAERLLAYRQAVKPPNWTVPLLPAPLLILSLGVRHAPRRP